MTVRGGEFQTDVVAVTLIREADPPTISVPWIKSHTFYLGLDLGPHERHHRDNRRASNCLNVFDVTSHNSRIYVAYTCGGAVRIDSLEQAAEQAREAASTVPLFTHGAHSETSFRVDTARFVSVAGEVYVCIAMSDAQQEHRIWRIDREAAVCLDSGDSDTIEAVHEALSER